MLDKNFCHGCYRADINLKYFLKYVVTDFKLVWNEDKIDLKNVVDFFFFSLGLTSKKIISSSILMKYRTVHIPECAKR